MLVGSTMDREKLEQDLIEFALKYAEDWALDNPTDTTIKTTWMRDAIYTAVHAGGLFIIKELGKNE